MDSEAQLWFPTGRKEGAGAPQLVCFPHSGSGASAYREWPSRLGEMATVLPVQLPGREQRIAEPLLTSAREVVDAMTDPALEVLRAPLVLFGHSMGALLAFELAHVLAARGRPPVHLVVSGYPAPQVGGVQPPMAQLPDERLEEYLHSLHGTDSAVFADRELVELLLPIVRADFTICDTYRFPVRPPLEIPLTVLAGRDDRTVPTASLQPWRATTTATTEFVTLPGGHFYLADQIEAVLDVLTSRLRPAMAACAPSERPSGPRPYCDSPGNQLAKRRMP